MNSWCRLLYNLWRKKRHSLWRSCSIKVSWLGMCLLERCICGRSIWQFAKLVTESSGAFGFVLCETLYSILSWCFCFCCNALALPCRLEVKIPNHTLPFENDYFGLVWLKWGDSIVKNNNNYFLLKTSLLHWAGDFLVCCKTAKCGSHFKFSSEISF